VRIPSSQVASRLEQVPVLVAEAAMWAASWCLQTTGSPAQAAAGLAVSVWEARRCRRHTPVPLPSGWPRTGGGLVHVPVVALIRECGSSPGRHRPAQHPLCSVAHGCQKRPRRSRCRRLVGVGSDAARRIEVPASWHWSGVAQTTGSGPDAAPAWQESVWVQASASVRRCRPLLGIGDRRRWPVHRCRVVALVRSGADDGLPRLRCPACQVSRWCRRRRRCPGPVDLGRVGSRCRSGSQTPAT